MMNDIVTARHSGAVGDVLYALPYLKSTGLRYRLLIGDHSLVDCRVTHANSAHAVDAMARRWPTALESRAPDGYSNFATLERLLRAQPYIADAARYAPGMAFDLDLDRFRQGFTTKRHIASQVFERFGGVEGGWRQSRVLEGVEPDARYAGRVAVARSFRYRDDRKCQQWAKLVQRLCESTNSSPVFVGVPSEHEDFERRVLRCEHADTRDMLDAARVIAACATGVYNSSAPHALAQLLAKPLHTECQGIVSRDTSLHADDRGTAF